MIYQGKRGIDVHLVSTHIGRFCAVRYHGVTTRPLRGDREVTADRGRSGPEYRECVAEKVMRSWTVEEFFADAAPPTEDDVPITRDGRVLDTPAKVIAFIEEINAARSGSGSR